MMRDNLNRLTHQEGNQKWLKHVPIKYTSYITANKVLISFLIKIDGEKIYEKSLSSRMAHLSSCFD